MYTEIIASTKSKTQKSSKELDLNILMNINSKVKCIEQFLLLSVPYLIYVGTVL